MTTRHGVQMSPRMERVWKFIREERKISLTDFSTDDCVEAVQGALREGEKILVARLAKDPGNTDLQVLLVDYRTIMNRRPQERVHNAKQATAKADVAVSTGGDSVAEKIARGGW